MTKAETRTAGLPAVILFDNDGTLVDSVPAIFRATNAALTDRGFPEVPLEEVADGMKSETLLRMAGHARIEDESVAKLLSREFYRHLEGSIELIRIFDGVEATLRRLRDAGIRLGVVSNNRQAVVERVLEANGIGDLFSLVIGEDNADQPKPAPGGILQACRHFGASPGSCVMVGDSLSDSRAARAAGMASVGVSWNHHDRTPIASLGFTWTIDHPDELMELASRN